MEPRIGKYHHADGQFTYLMQVDSCETCGAEVQLPNTMKVFTEESTHTMLLLRGYSDPWPDKSAPPELGCDEEGEDECDACE